MKAPSFFIETEEKDKMMLQYRYNMVKCNLLKEGFWRTHPKYTPFKIQDKEKGLSLLCAGPGEPYFMCNGVKFPFHLKTSQELRMLSRSLSDCKSRLLNVMIQVLQFVSNSQLCHYKSLIQ